MGRADTHYIETPEQVELAYSVAGVGSRFVAALLDGLIISAFFFFELMAMVMIGAASTVSPAAGSLTETAGKWFIAFVVFVNFAIVC
jgi:uncharacterized RDD family membrane protein YckC